MAVTCFFGRYSSAGCAAKLCILLVCLLLSSLSFSAGLGQLRVRSALGERFDAIVLVASSDPENVTSDCFQLATPHEESDIRVLHRARFEYKRLASGGGELHIQGLDIEQEPLLKMAVQLRCPQDDARGVTREYSVLIDPREYKAAAPVVDRIPPPVVAPLQNTASTPAMREKPVRRARVVIPVVPSSSPQQTIAMADKSAKSARAKPKEPAGRGEFRLQLSTAPLDSARTDLNLSEDDKLKLRERLLLIDADDQTAQLLQLKDRISRLEKQLSTLHTTNVSAPVAVVTPALRAASAIKPVQDAGRNNWLWIGLALLLLLPLGYMLWRWKTRNQSEPNVFSFDEDFNAPDTPVQHVESPVPDTPSAPRPASFVRASDGWGSGDDMDVVSPGNVAEEAQMLLDHGLLRQAIDLLLNEVALRPTALALWMKLFDAYRSAGDGKGFQAQALAFQSHFASDALWRQVQTMGREIEPRNPLYIAHEAQSIDELAVPLDHEPSGNDDFDLQHMIQHVDATAPDKEALPHDQEAVLPLEFSLPEVTLPMASGEWPDLSASFVQEDEHLFGFDAPSLEPPVLEMLAESKSLAPEDFVSEDSVLHTISRMIFSDQRDEACQQLESLLYRGTFEQRLVAARWLGKILPVRSM